MKQVTLFVFLTFTIQAIGVAQSSLSISSKIQRLSIAPIDADSNYIRRYTLLNDVRLLYGGDGTSLAFGSTRNGNRINTSLYNNVNDLIGVGLTYKIIDADISFSLPQTRILEEDRENLQQFRLALSFTGRKIAYRGFLTKSIGMVSTDEGGEFESRPDVKLIKVGAQITYIFNERKYSYRASNFQNELQKKTAGSFLLRLEPSYRYLEAPTGLVPASRDVATTYGDQAGLQYIGAPGVLLLPGYGINIVMKEGKFFISPFVLAGPGFAVNTYRSDNGEHTSLNYEWSAAAVLNAGYNGTKVYTTLRIAYDTYYTSFNPSYLTTSNLKISLTVGYRFANLEKFIPTSLF